MAKKVEKIEEKIIAVESALSRTERYFEEHYKVVVGIVGGIIVIVLGVFGYIKYVQQPREREAQSQMFVAQHYFEMDSLKLALNGDGNAMGFLSIADEYSSTKAGNLAQYYSGICYLKMGDFDNAISHLEEFSSKDEILSCMAIGAIGDAYLEKGDQENALKQYLEASENKDNLFTTPMFLMKAGLIYEMQNKWEDALKLYQRIKKDYHKSYEANEIDKYIGRAEANLNL